MEFSDDRITICLLTAIYGGVIGILLYKSYFYFIMTDTSKQQSSALMKKKEQQQSEAKLSTKSIKKKGSPRENANSVVLNRKMIGANWENFMLQQNKIPANAPTTVPTRSTAPPKCNRTTNKLQQQQQTGEWTTNGSGQEIKVTKHISMDCEMVGVGYLGKDHMLARLSIVNQSGDIIMDKYVKPREAVVDYRTYVSGIRPRDLENGEHFIKVQREVAELLKNRVLIGHAVHNDLKVLLLSHPQKYTRDTSRYRQLAKRVTGGATPSLKTLTRVVLGYDIQDGEHSSVEDARAAMRIYNKCSQDWEKYLRRRNNGG